MSNEQSVQVALQRIYLKDLSFESPSPIKSFQTKWEPKVKLDIQSQNQRVDNDLYEVSLELTATVTIGESTAFIVEVEQAGIFMVKGVEGEPLQRILSTFCMNVLFPYAREAVDSMCLKGSFPPLVLAPVNFDALYEQSKQQES